MSTLAKTSDEISPVIENPTRFPTEQNKYEIRCGACYELFHVNEMTHNQVRRAVEFDPSDNPFRCDDCEEEYDEEAGY